jgi:hypothetical protein
MAITVLLIIIGILLFAAPIGPLLFLLFLAGCLYAFAAYLAYIRWPLGK